MKQPDNRESTASSGPSVGASESPRPGLVLVRSAVLAIVALLAAGLAYLAIGGIGEVFRLPPELAKLGAGGPPPPEDQARLSAGNLVLRYKHSALWLAATGAILGGLFGLTLGAFRRSRISWIAGLAGGLVFGTLLGAVGGLLAVYIDRLLQTNMPQGELTAPEHMVIAMHAATWTVIGLGLGLGTGLGVPIRRARSAAMAMLVAGLAGTVGGGLYVLLAGFALPLADASQPVPGGDWNRLLWLGLPSLLIGLALGRRG